MSSYQPIYSNRRATATDRVISIEKEPFESAPALSFLNSYEETITANPAFYDPFKPELSEAAPVSYNISRTINTLSDRTIALRHNGNTVDMEISVDTYNYIPKEPIVAPYSPNPKLSKIREGDFYNRSTTTYIYKDVEVPKASNKIWDGRYTRCVDLQGYDVPNGDRLPEVIAEVKSKLDNPTQLYTVLPIAGMATTVAPPKKDPYAATYKVKVQQFIATHYNSLALTRHPKGKTETDLYQELPQEGGDKKFTLQEGFVAAVLDGPYFVRWANVYRYADTAPDAADNCSHRVVDYDQDNDAVIVLGDLCGLETLEPLLEPTIYNHTFGYVPAGVYEYPISTPFLPSNCNNNQTQVIQATIESIQPASVDVNNISINQITYPFLLEPPITLKLYHDGVGAAYVNTQIRWVSSCVDL